MTHALFAEAPTRLGEHWIIPVCATIVQRVVGTLGRAVFMTKTPEAVVLVGPDGARALAMDGSVRDLAQLYDAVPGLRAIASSLG